MVLVLSGPVHGGKTTLLERSLPLWAGRGLSCSGFISSSVADGGCGTGYDLVEIGTGRRWPYLRRQGDAGAERVGPFAFVPETLERARSIIRSARPSGLLVIDEVGPLELRGGGLWTSLSEALATRGRTLLLVIREGLVEDFAARLAPAVPRVFDVREPDARERLEESLFGAIESDDDQG